jgi:hypothetical protein
MPETPTPELPPLPPYQPASQVGDLVALIRAEHYAMRAEALLASADPSAPGGMLKGSMALSEASTCAALSQTWAWIAVVYQGPGDTPTPERMRDAQAEGGGS